MTMIRHELRQGRLSFLIWTASIGFLLAVCIFLYPEMQGEMEGMNEMFSSMGSFTEAFGMDKISFGTLTGFYAVECGNILGLGGAFFTSLCAVSILAKEEKEHTAEFLFTHPVSRVRLVVQKLAAVLIQIILLNLVIFLLAAAGISLIGEPVPWKELQLLHTAYFLLQLELAGICFGISAFLRTGSTGVGLGIAALMYFLNLIANISEQAEFLKFVTPFGYADGAQVVTELCLDKGKVIIGMVVAVTGGLCGIWKYWQKDIF